MNPLGEAILLLPVVVFSVVVHECAHALVALWRGDPTARDRGRLTLNPLPHLHWLGSVALPLGLALAGSPVLFGWAKPVPMNGANLRDLRNDPLRVALAGPLSNLLLAALFAAGLALAPGLTGAGAARLCAYGVLLNSSLAVVNMIPIPPLDGSWLVLRFLPLRHLYALAQLRFVGLALLAVLLAVPVVNYYLLQLPVHSLAGGLLRCVGLAPGRLAEALR